MCFIGLACRYSQAFAAPFIWRDLVVVALVTKPQPHPPIGNDTHKAQDGGAFADRVDLLPVHPPHTLHGNAGLLRNFLHSPGIGMDQRGFCLSYLVGHVNIPLSRIIKMPEASMTPRGNHSIGGSGSSSVESTIVVAASIAKSVFSRNAQISCTPQGSRCSRRLQVYVSLAALLPS